MESTGPKPRLNVFGYLDETGLLHTSRTDRLFGLGLLICPNPRELHRAIIRLNNKRRYHNEFKFSDITKQNLPVYLELIDIFFDCTNNRFHVCLVDKQVVKVVSGKGHHTAAYNKLAAGLVANAIDKGRGKASEYVTILADDVSTNKDDRFERVIRDTVRRKLRRNALFGIARLESHAISELQIVDVLLGLVAYSYKIKLGLVRGGGAKLRLLKHLQKKLGITELSTEQVIRLRRGELFEVKEITK